MSMLRSLAESAATADDEFDLELWTLKTCCDTQETIFLALYFAYGLFIHCFFQSKLLYPFKLLCVFVHEYSHALATWITCGKVKKIEVYGNEGGVTHFSGGWRCCVIPAGYTGTAFWGGAIVALSGHRVGSTVAACLLSAALIVALCYKPNNVVVYMSIGFCIVTFAIIYVDWFVFDPILPYFTLWYGVFFGYYGIRDIWDDTIKETKEGSDAVACHNYMKCCLPKCVGMQFMILGLIFQVVGIYLALVWLLSR
jgi:Peptidase M50B-like